MNNENMVNNQQSEPVVEPTVEPQNETVQPAEPVQPTVPIETVTPVAPTAPVTPVAPMDPTMQVQPSSPVSSQPKSNKGLIIGIIAVILIAAIGIGVYFLFFRKVSGKEVVNGTVNMIFQKAIDASEEIEKSIIIDFKNDIVQSKGNVTVRLSSETPEIASQLETLNSAGIDYDLRLDLKTLSGSFDFTEIENDNKIVTFNTFLKDKKFYFGSDALSSTYYVDLKNEIDWDKIDISKLPEYNSAAVSKLLGKIKEALKNAIKDEYITQEEGEYVIDGTTIKGLKTTISINQKELIDIEKSILDELTNDDEAIDIISSIIMKNKQDTKTIMQNAVNQYNSNETSKLSDEKVNINIITTNNGKFLAFQCIQKYNDVKSGIEAVNKDGIINIKIYNNGTTEYEFNYNEKENELTYDKDGIKLSIKFEKNGIKATFTADGITVSLEFNKKIEDNGITLNTKLSGDYDKDNTKIKGSIETTNTTSKATEIHTFDSHESKDVTTLTYSDQEIANNELNKVAEKSALLTIIKSMLEVQETPTRIYTVDDCDGLECYDLEMN